MYNEGFYGSPAGRVRAAREPVQGCCVRGKMPVASWREESATRGGSGVTRGAGGRWEQSWRHGGGRASSSPNCKSGRPKVSTSSGT